MKTDRTLSMATVRLGKRQYGVVAADAAADAGESLTRRVVARTATETVCVTEFDRWRIREGRTQRGLVVPRRFTRNWISHAKVALKDDVSGALFKWSLIASTEEEHQTAGLVLS